jgi:hypothetical protein
VKWLLLLRVLRDSYSERKKLGEARVKSLNPPSYSYALPAVAALDCVFAADVWVLTATGFVFRGTLE